MVAASNRAALGSQAATAFVRRQARRELAPTEQLLAEGGDLRIELDLERGLNKYGCPPMPDPALAAFGSSTASTISEGAFEAAGRLRRRLEHAGTTEPPEITYARELNRQREELARLSGVADLRGLEIIFAPSGTDLHLLAGQLARGTSAQPLLALMVEAAETGSGVPAALAGRHFSARTALGDTVSDGAVLGEEPAIELIAIAARTADGMPRPPVAIDLEIEERVAQAEDEGRGVLLTVVDVSKTGLIAPTAAFAVALRERYPETVEVLVDACQYRLAPASLRGYLEQGFMVALTGSKFLTGPTFCGALLVPGPTAARLRKEKLPRAVAAYSARADWPRGWAAAGTLREVANYGLLLRWEAALEELRAFRAVPERSVARFLAAFAEAVRARLRADPVFEALPVPELDRRPVVEPASWDHLPTIFPFLLRRLDGRHTATPFGREEMARIYKLLASDIADPLGLRAGDPHWNLAVQRCEVGQPVLCGSRNGILTSALRLCASARLIVEGVAAGRLDRNPVIRRALVVLDKAALIAREWPRLGGDPPASPDRTETP
ncbi:MAG TPA: hypothetical protein VMU85_03165 [Stellaceae bacterium]|nr:hypothetical protein [Stellaceae bacterium]